MNNKRSIYYYLGISFVFSWTLFLLPLAFKSDPFAYQRMTRPFWAAAMWGPALAAILVTLFIAREPFGTLRLNRLGSFRYYLAAWFIPPLLVAAAIGLSILFGTAQFDSNLTSVQALADQSARAGVRAVLAEKCSGHRSFPVL